MAERGASQSRAGFTLIELLVVISILLTLALAIVPNIGAGISGTQLSTAARSLLQAARYARTMSILHQVETELVLVSAAEGARAGVNSDGKPDPRRARIEVRIAEGALRNVARDGEAREAELASQDGGRGWDAREAELASQADAWDGEGMPSVGDGAASTGAAISDLAEEVRSVFDCGTVVFKFTRFTEEYDDEADEPDEETLRRARGEPRETAGWDDEPDSEADDAAERTIVFVFDSDGTCEPFELELLDGPDARTAAMTIAIDRWGRGRIEGRDDD